MPLEPGSFAAWLQYAQNDLRLARAGANSGILYELLCFHRQQAAEKPSKQF